MSRAPVAFVTELFWLSRSRARAKRLSEHDRSAFDRRLRLGRQRAAAAQSLWADGHRAEGLRLAVEAFDATVGTVAPFGAAAGLVEASSADARPVDGSSGEVAPRQPSTDEDPSTQAAPPQEQATDDDAPTDDEAREEQAITEDAPTDDEAREEQASDASTDDEAREERAITDDASTDEQARVRAALLAEGMGEKSVAAVLDATRRRQDIAVPGQDDDIAPAHAELFRRLLSARRRVDPTLRRSLMSQKRAVAHRIARIGTPLVVLVVAAITAYVATRVPEGVNATASGQYSRELGAPAAALDGNPTTEWLTPDAQAGWLEITINPPQNITTLRLLNGHNRHYNDRAVRHAIVQVFSDGDLARTIDQRWPRIEPEPAWVEHSLRVEQVDRIRFEVESFHEHGAALAEISWQ
jgi:hypothetical protein